MIDLKNTPFMRIVAVIAVTLVVCFVMAASAMMFANPEYIEMAKKIIMIAGAFGLFLVVLTVVMSIIELLFAGAITVIFAIGLVIVEGWKKLTKVDTLGEDR